MSTINLHSKDVEGHYVSESRESVVSRFWQWVKQEEKNRIAWVGISVTSMAAIFFPITMAAILFNGAHFGLIIGAMISLALVVITNLAALPTRYTIPSFLIGIFMDFVLILVSFSIA